MTKQQQRVSSQRAVSRYVSKHWRDPGNPRSYTVHYVGREGSTLVFLVVAQDGATFYLGHRRGEAVEEYTNAETFALYKRHHSATEHARFSHPFGSRPYGYDDDDVMTNYPDEFMLKGR